MNEINLLSLLKSGAHFGHTTSRWNPKMKPYIFSVRNNIHILDLEKTKQLIIKAAEFAKKIAQNNGTILFVGTKKQTKETCKTMAEFCGMPFINVRWLGGTFTNHRTILKTVRKLEKLEGLKASGELEQKYTKKERLLIEREITKLNRLFEGIKNLKRLPEAIFITDIRHEQIAVKEAQKSKVKIIGIADTNSDPVGIDYLIPCNDDSAKAIMFISEIIAASIIEGKQLIPQTVPAPVTLSQTSTESIKTN